MSEPLNESHAAANAEPVHATVKPFTPQQLAMQRTIDRTLWWLAVGLLVLAGVMLLLVDHAGGLTTLLIAGGIIFGWLFLNAASAKTHHQIGAITMCIDVDPARAEAMLHQAISRYPLLSWVRLMLYHRLALLRARQQRPQEAVWICQSVLASPLGPASYLRGNLLLIQAEASLALGDMTAAYHALTQLHQMPLNLRELLGLTTLQTRYEVMLHQDQAVLAQMPQRVRQAELMPPAVCGAMHAMLAIPAQRQSQQALAHWLEERAELLLSPEQREAFASHNHLHEVSRHMLVSPHAMPENGA